MAVACHYGRSSFHRYYPPVRRETAHESKVAMGRLACSLCATFYVGRLCLHHYWFALLQVPIRENHSNGAPEHVPRINKIPSRELSVADQNMKLRVGERR